jgi:hypothetical protein
LKKIHIKRKIQNIQTMEIINNSIHWVQETGEILITGIKKVSNYDLQCILSRNPRRFIVNTLDENSLAVLEKIKKKTDIPYLEIHHIRNGGDNLINCLPNGIAVLHIGYNVWNKDIQNLPNSLIELDIWCYSIFDCMHLPHGLEILKIAIEISNLDLSNLPSSIKKLVLYCNNFAIDLSSIPRSIEFLELIDCNDSNDSNDSKIINNDYAVLDHILILNIRNKTEDGSITKLLENLSNKITNCNELYLEIYHDISLKELNLIPEKILKITLELRYKDEKGLKDLFIKYARDYPGKEIIILE